MQPIRGLIVAHEVLDAFDRRVSPRPLTRLLQDEGGRRMLTDLQRARSVDERPGDNECDQCRQSPRKSVRSVRLSAYANGYGETRRPASAKATAVRRSIGEGGSALRARRR